MVFGENAVGALRKSLICDVEATIETRPEILPRDHAGQLDELFITELLSKMVDLFVGRGCRCRTQGGRVVQYVLLEIAERSAFSMLPKIEKLVFRDAMFSADGRVDIQSEQTPDHGRGLQAGQYLDLRFNALCAVKTGLESTRRRHHTTTLCHDP